MGKSSFAFGANDISGFSYFFSGFVRDSFGLDLLTRWLLPEGTADVSTSSLFNHADPLAVPYCVASRRIFSNAVLVFWPGMS